MAGVSGLHQVLFTLNQHGIDMQAEVESELDVLAQMAARIMRDLASKWRTTLANSIAVSAPFATVREIRPGVDYGSYVEDGIKPGGRGLPRFFDPASASIVAWLESKSPSGFMGPHSLVRKRKSRKGSKLFTEAEKVLRDRYEGLALHVRKFGVQAQPFVNPTAKEMEPIVLARMGDAVRRVLAARPSAGGSVA
jgi:hypothetical protein